MNLTFGLYAACLAVALPTAAMVAQNGPTPHPLGTVVATAATSFTRITQIVPQSDGHLFVADAGTRIVWRLDASLAGATIVLDSAAGKQNSFSVNSFLSSFRGDSALFFDAKASTFVVIDPVGQIGRVMASPPMAASLGIYASEYGVPASSPTLGLAYKVSAPVGRPTLAPGAPDVTIRTIDSMAVIRMDFVTRGTDTLAKLGTERTQISTYRDTRNIASSVFISPFPFYDEAVVTSDGSIALFHAREYRLEWVNGDATRSPGVRMPFDWRKITDEDRARLLDSVNGLKRHAFDSVVAKRAADSARTGAGPTSRMISLGADGERTERLVPAPPPRMTPLAAAEDIPDFRPPTGPNAVFADADNHIWIRPLPPVPQPGADAVWDVIDRKNAVIDRVRVPAGATIAGFAPGGFVLLVVRDAGIATLEKVRVR